MLDRKLYQIMVQTMGENCISEYGYNFSNRLITQKTLYLLTKRENSRIKLSYKWTFYLYGPYSSEIAHMIYYMKDYKANLHKSKNELNKADLQEIEHFKVFLRDIESQTSQTLKKETLYELLATILYLQKELGEDSVKIFDKLRELKPRLHSELNLELFSSINQAVDQIRTGI